jgi:hypothetical protein
MVIIAPDSQHENTKALAGVSTYKNRVWTRAEVLAHYCHSGVETMYLQTSTDFSSVPDNWMESICCVFEGDMTCCRLHHSKCAKCDRESLVLPLLGLYFSAYVEGKSADADDRNAQVWKLISTYKDRMFPRTYQYVTKHGVEERELFGDTLEWIEEIADRKGTPKLTRMASEFSEISKRNFARMTS